MPQLIEGHQASLHWIHTQALCTTQDVFSRTVTVLRHQGNVYCMDAACSHMGGPLGAEGDIEDFDGRSCIRCPWHGRKVRRDTLPERQLYLNETRACMQLPCDGNISGGITDASASMSTV